MKKLTAATLNMILAMGVICILAGIVFFARLASIYQASVENWTMLFVFAGAVIFYLSLTAFKYAILFFIGLFACLCGTLFMFISSSFFSAGVKELWPLSVIIAGVCTVLTGIAKDRRIRSAFLCPAIFLICIGGFFLLFSTDVIEMSFASFVSMWWPILPVLLGASLVAIFLLQQNPVTNEHFPYDKELDSDADNEGEVRE